MTEFLSRCRFLMIVPVIGCLACSLVLVLLGIVRIVECSYVLISAGDFSTKMNKVAALAAIEIIDLFLVGTVAYITALGLYKLFISSTEVDLPMRLKIRNLSDLENKIIGVIVAALAVAVMGKASGDYEAITLLYYGAGIALVIAALGLFVYLTDTPVEPQGGTVKPTRQPGEEETKD